MSSETNLDPRICWWLTNLSRGETDQFIRNNSFPRNELIVDQPRATEQYSSESLACMGIVGVYRVWSS